MASTLEELRATFSSAKELEFSATEHGLARVNIRNTFCEGLVYVQGAQVAEFQPRGQQPVLWMSRASLFESGKPIRGGIPICWPWFGPYCDPALQPAPAVHGFARNLGWALEHVESGTAGTQLVFGLRAGAQTKMRWPGVEAEWSLEYRVLFGAALEATLHFKNGSTQPLTFEQALHTYLTVGDVKQVEIRGLEGVEYIDKLRQAQRFKQSGVLRIEAETDRVYQNTSAPVEACDPVLKRTLRVEGRGSRSTVVWNPWIAKARAMPDFGDEEWPGMLCIETANALENKVRVAPGAAHEITARISVS